MLAPVSLPSVDELNVHPMGAEPGSLPLMVEPGPDRSAEGLAERLKANPAWTQERLRRHGAFLFRGFDVDGPADFERIARAVDDDLKNEYLGTSPRDALTDYVFSASELPSYYPIPQHCEMSFVKNYPRRVFFCCLVAPQDGGETPLVDFRKVYADLDPKVRQRFIDRGIRGIRNYCGPQGGGRFDLWKLKRWDEMFQTTDRAAVEAKCREEGFEPSWAPNERLRLVSEHSAVHNHPETGEPVWFNHSLVFHLSTAPGEYSRIYRRRRDLRSLFLWQLSRLLVAMKRSTPAVDQAMHCTYLDGSEIPDADMEHVRDVVWKHMVIYPWRRGDVVAIDNHAVGHGRLPYSGPRQVVVCWA
jgi:alpha-ketoglutarate-dependent taurine dioxygenase